MGDTTPPDPGEHYRRVVVREIHVQTLLALYVLSTLVLAALLLTVVTAQAAGRLAGRLLVAARGLSVRGAQPSRTPHPV